MRGSLALTLLGLMLAASRPAWAGMDEARAALLRHDYAAAQQQLRPLAESGMAEAQFDMGWLSFRGLGLPQDDREAARWFGLAADQGNAQAEGSLGALMLAGRGVPRNETAAVALLEASARQGDTGAMLSLGRCAADGRGMSKSVTEAAHWYRMAADKGNAAAQNALGMLLWQGGDGFPADRAQAVTWFKQAAARGLAYAQYNLGKAYEAGVGLPQNLAEAYYWLSLASAQAKPGDKVFAERDAVAGKLPPEQLTQLQQRASQFRPALANGALTPGTSAFGTAFFVHNDGVALTNAHVVKACKSIAVSGPAGHDMPARVVASDEANDLAILKTSMVPPAVAILRADPPLRAGEGVVVIGYPLTGLLSSDPIVTEGAVSALAGMRNDSRFVQVSAPVQPGNSGGPLLDLSGHVVGVVTSKLNALSVASVTGDLPQNINFALKEGIIRNFLDAEGVHYSQDESANDMKAADVVEKARAFVVAVQCRH